MKYTYTTIMQLIEKKKNVTKKQGKPNQLSVKKKKPLITKNN